MNTNNEKIVHISYYDEDEGNTYAGAFTIKRHTVKDISSINVRRAQLNGGLHVGDNGTGIDPETDAFNGVIATLEVSVVAAPAWYNLNAIYSQGLLFELYKEVKAFQSTFRRDRGVNNVSRGQSTEVQEGSGKANEVAVRSGAPTEVVSGEVSFTLEP